MSLPIAFRLEIEAGLYPLLELMLELLELMLELMELGLSCDIRVAFIHFIVDGHVENSNSIS